MPQKISPTPQKAGYAIYAFTAKGALLAKRIAKLLQCAQPLESGSKAGLTANIDPPLCAVYLSKSATQEPKLEPNLAADLEQEPCSTHYFVKLSELLKDTFSAYQAHTYQAHIFIGAVGIAVRGIAPFIKSKASDPAVLVLDQQAKYVISLLSGHLGGANQLCLQLANELKAQAIISTATDLEGVPAIDLMAQQAGLIIENLGGVQEISSAILNKQTVFLYDPQNYLNISAEQKAYFKALLHESNPQELSPQVLTQTTEAMVYVGTKIFAQSQANILFLRPQKLWLGLGCQRNTPVAELHKALTEFLRQAQLSSLALAGIASIEAKSDEVGILELAKELNLPLFFFSAEQLKSIKTPSVSPKALELFGTASVAEAAALLAAKPHKNAKLIINKQVFKGITLALARADNCINSKNN